MESLLGQAPPVAANPILARAIAERARACAQSLQQVRELCQRGVFIPALGQLVADAQETLDEIDQLLRDLNAQRNGREFAMAATLHREVDQVLATARACLEGSRSRGIGERGDGTSH